MTTIERITKGKKRILMSFLEFLRDQQCSQEIPKSFKDFSTMAQIDANL